MNKERILSALGEIAPGRDIGKLADDTNLIELGVIDSGMFLDLIFLLEEQSGIEVDFEENDAAEMTSISGLCSVFAA